MAECVGDGHWAVKVKAWLLHYSIRDRDGPVLGVTPVTAVFAAIEQSVKQLVNPWTSVKGDGSAEQVKRGLDDRQGAPLAGVGIVDTPCTHVKREFVASLPPERAAVGGTPQKRHRRNRVEPLVDVVLPECVERQTVVEAERRVAKDTVIIPCLAVKMVLAAGQACSDLEAVTHRHGKGNAGSRHVTQAGIGRVGTRPREVTASHAGDDTCR